MKQFRAAVVGCGRIGSTIDDEIDRWSSTMLPYSHAARYAEALETELAAGCDADPAKAEAFGERWGLDRAFTDIDEMMEATHPDIVSIATETAARTDAGLKVAAHDLKALFIDKPVAETLRDADRLLDACRDRGIVVAVNCSRVWDPRAIRAREMLDEGMIGELRCVVGFCRGGLSHMGSHLLTFMQFYAGRADWVVGETDPPPEDAPDRDVSGLGLIQYEDGVHGYLNMLDAGPISVELDLIGTEGRIRATNNQADWELWLPGRVPTRDSCLARQQFPMPPRMTSWGVKAVQDICRCIETGGKPLCDGEDGRHALEIALALRHSQREGNVRVDLPFQDLDAALLSA